MPWIWARQCLWNGTGGFFPVRRYIKFCVSSLQDYSTTSNFTPLYLRPVIGVHIGYLGNQVLRYDWPSLQKRCRMIQRTFIQRQNVPGNHILISLIFDVINPKNPLCVLVAFWLLSPFLLTFRSNRCNR